MYALENPFPDKTVSRLVFEGGRERVVLYAISSTRLREHPLRARTRRKVRLPVPAGARFNEIGELEGVQIDLGSVISARRALDYDQSRWDSAQAVVEPELSDTDVVIEYAAHPSGRLYLSGAETVVYDLSELEGPDPGENVVPIPPANLPVRVEIVDADTGELLPARVHMHGVAGEYLPTRGHHRKVNPYWFEDNYGEHINVQNQYGYVEGSFEVELPIGSVFVEVLKGFEYPTHRSIVEVTSETRVLRIELRRLLHWRESGWVSADTHVHFLSPSTALLEGRAEGINVVNLLVAQWGEMFSNVTDFDGATTLGEAEPGGGGEFLVRVGSENRSQVLGHISLLGYSGSLIHPLSTGGPTESAIGDALESSLSVWARQCIRQGGMVVIPHSPHPQAERAATIVLGLVHAIEMKVHNPRHPETDHHVSPYGLADWYKYLNLGYEIPLVAGSDKMRATDLLGGIRTYALLGDGRELTYDNWMRAVQDGNTFVTVGPLVSMSVNGVVPGRSVDLPAGGGTVTVSWKVESAVLPFTSVEIIRNGTVAEEIRFADVMRAEGEYELRVTEPSWVAVRVRGSYRGDPHDVAAHTSAVQVSVDGVRTFAPHDAVRFWIRSSEPSPMSTRWAPQGTRPRHGASGPRWRRLTTGCINVFTARASSTITALRPAATRFCADIPSSESRGSRLSFPPSRGAEEAGRRRRPASSTLGEWIRPIAGSDVPITAGDDPGCGLYDHGGEEQSQGSRPATGGGVKETHTDRSDGAQ